MSKIFNFVKEKAFVLMLVGCIIAATVTSIWAIRTVQRNLIENLYPDSAQDETQQGGILDNLPDDIGGIDPWEQDAGLVTGEPDEEIPLDGQDTQSTPKPSASSSSGVSSSSEPSETPAVSPEQEAAAKPSLVPPVSGLILAQFSGTELVYNETLGDWRTHNGVDYAAKKDESVFSPVAGEVTKVYTDGNWGGVVEIEDSNGYTWRLCGVEKPNVSIANMVVAGQKIGQIGEISAEITMETHLHLEVLKDGKYHNPTDFLK